MPSVVPRILIFIDFAPRIDYQVGEFPLLDTVPIQWDCVTNFKSWVCNGVCFGGSNVSQSQMVEA
jgi:hypothetical protein